MKRYYPLILILLLASVLRLFKLAINPPSLYWDEASIGYNAFAILTQGVDEHGVPWPITHFLAYGDAKPPLYIYATSLSFALLGVSEFSLRLPSALAGIFSVFLTYLLVHRLFPLHPHRRLLASLAALLLAISPWHLQMSRAAFEANLGLAFFLAATYFFLAGTTRPRLWLASAIFYSLTLYTFNAYRLFLPFFLLFLFVHFYSTIKQHWQPALLSFSLAAIIILPLIPFALSDQAKLRFNEVTIFNDHQPVIEANTRISLNHNAFWARLIHNRRVLFAQSFLRHYSDHFKPDFLFFSGDVNPRLSVRDLGQMYPIELPLLLLGIYSLIKTRQPAASFLLLWWLLAPIPAGVARETPHALRSLQTLPVPQIIVALGLVTLISSRPRLKFILVGLYLIFFIYYLDIYHFHYPRHWANSWQYGYKQMVEYITPLANKFDKVYITQSLGRPHTYLLFYQQVKPSDYLAQRRVSSDPFGFTYTHQFGRYYFSDPPAQKLPTESWLVVSTQENPAYHHLHTIYDLNNQPVFVIQSL